MYSGRARSQLNGTELDTPAQAIVRFNYFMRKRNTNLASRLAVVAASVFILSMAGCASSTAEPEQNTRESRAPSSEPTRSSPQPGEAAISTDHVCGQVSALATLEGNTRDGYAAGVLGVDQFVAHMDMVATGYEHVLVNDSEVGNRVEDSVLFLKTAAPSAEGARFDHGSPEWQNAISAVAEACNNAGSSVTLLADFGG